ncbi:MAG: DNA polymerase, partial [Pseudomonadota bacterium]
VQTLFGRKNHTPEIGAKGPRAGFAWRAAINAPIQGTAADIIRRAMIRVPQAISSLPATMLLQVHDELLFEVSEEAVEPVIAAVRTVMEGACDPAVHLSVPLTVDAGTGANWAAAHQDWQRQGPQPRMALIEAVLLGVCNALAGGQAVSV